MFFCEFCKIFDNSFSTKQNLHDIQCHIYLDDGIKSNLLKRTRKEHISGVYSDPSQKSDVKLFPITLYGLAFYSIQEKLYYRCLTDASISLRAANVLSERDKLWF